MYHYVRPDDPSLPYFRHLPLDGFRQQLDWFAARHRFVSTEELERAARNGKPAPDGLVLTFDDGLQDHFQHVFPELNRRGITGVFYVSTGPFETGRMLDVHRLHMLIGAFGGKAVWQSASAQLRPEMFSHGHVREFREATYSAQSNDDCTRALKRTFNYYIDYRHRGPVIDNLVSEFFGGDGELNNRLYLSLEQLRAMRDAGMIIGSHTVNHYCLSKLEFEDQRREIRNSFAFLESHLPGNGLKTFCYPYGGAHTFNSQTEQFLEEEGCLFSFSVQPRDIVESDLTNRKQALPRYDCNMFPHGSARAFAAPHSQ